MSGSFLKTVVVTAIVIALAQPSICTTRMSTATKAVDLLQRHRRQSAPLDEPGRIDCVLMTAEEGDYWHVSTGSDAVCGLYVIGDVDTIVEMEISDFNVECGRSGLVAIVDGWELQGELFPSPDDVADMGAQYQTFCGPSPPPALYASSQNAALLQFRVPHAGQGFRVRVRFLQNPRPCNVLAPFSATAFTLRNFGLRRNCTTHLLFPVDVQLINVNVGTTPTQGRVAKVVSGLSVSCDGLAGADVASLMYGTGLDTAYFDTRMAFCGSRSKTARRDVTLGCSHSAIRLQSSGMYYNSLSVEVSSPGEQQLLAFLSSNPHCAAFK